MLTAMGKEPAPQKIRLDQLVAARSLARSRSAARDAIRRGCVAVDGETVTRPGRLVTPNSALTVDDPAGSYVSRGALKLIGALAHFRYPVAGRCAIDLGASTGGFTQVLLERGASDVVAVDVGRGQMHASIAGDPRVTRLEGINARDLDRGLLGDLRADALVCDVSFISLRIALPPALKLLASGAWVVALVKPQFEAGATALGKDGVLRDPDAAKRIVREIVDFVGAIPGFSVDGAVASPVTGGDGNREYLLGARKA